MDVQELIAVAKAVEPDVIKVQQWLHRNPFTRWEETPAIAYLLDQIVEFIPAKGRGPNQPVPTFYKRFTGGLVVDLDFNPSFDRLLFRADIDALPIPEETGLPFASQIPGKMHACGHDIHSAMLFGACKALMQGVVEPRHNFRFVWQRAEENPGSLPSPISGGDLLVEESVCNGVAAAYALHVWNSPDSEFGRPGVFYSRPGGYLGNSGRIQMTVVSSGGHVGKPREGINAQRIANRIATHLETFLERNLPGQFASLEPTGCLSGNGLASSNVMPSHAELCFGFRTVLPRNEHHALMDRIEAEAMEIGRAMGGEIANVQKIGGHPAMINDEAIYAKTMIMLKDAGQVTAMHPQSLGGEDFAHYLYKVPGCMWMLGSYTPGSGDHHSPTFNPDPSIFWRGVLFWLLLATN